MQGYIYSIYTTQYKVKNSVNKYGVSEKSRIYIIDARLNRKVWNDSNLVKLAVWDKIGEQRLEIVHVTGSRVLDVVASTGVLMWSHVSEFLMLKPVQVYWCDHRWVSSWCWSQYRCIDVITGERVLDAVASTDVLMWSLVSEFLMLNPAQVLLRAHLSEQLFIEDDDIVSFALSNAHITGPFFVFLNPLYDVTLTEFRRDVTGIITFIIISSSGRNTDIITMFIFSFWYPTYQNILVKDLRFTVIWIPVINITGSILPLVLPNVSFTCDERKLIYDRKMS